jgi:hypothetical protein
MIRHALVRGRAAGAITALMVAMIETASRGLLMATIGGAPLRTARLCTTRQTAIDLPAFAGGANKEDDAARADALTKRRGTSGMHRYARAGWTVLTRPSENTANEVGGLRSAQPPDEKPRLRLQPGLRFDGLMTTGCYDKRGGREIAPAPVAMRLRLRR